MRALPPIIEPRFGFGRVSLSIQLFAGALTDPAGKCGLAYLTAHALLLGTRRLPRLKFHALLESMGSSVEMVVGHHTTQISVVALLRYLPRTLALVAEMLAEPAFPEDEIEHLKTLMIGNHLLRSDDDDETAGRHFDFEIFEGKGYGLPADGLIDQLAGIEVEEIEGHYRAVLSRALRRFAVAGPLLRANLGSLPHFHVLNRGGASYLDENMQSPLEGRRVRLVDRPGATQAAVVAGHEALAAAHPDYPALSVAVTLFGGTFTSRLNRHLREKLGLCYYAECSLSVSRHPDTVEIFANPAVKDLVKTIRETEALYQRFCADGPTKVEFEETKKYMLNRLAFYNATPEARALNRLHRFILKIPQQSRKKAAARIQALKLAKVRESAKKYLFPERLVWTVIGPRKSLERDLTKLFGGKAIRVCSPTSL
jgi:zinc protease